MGPWVLALQIAPLLLWFTGQGEQLGLHLLQTEQFGLRFREGVRLLTSEPGHAVAQLCNRVVLLLPGEYRQLIKRDAVQLLVLHVAKSEGARYSDDVAVEQ